ncbi:SDR family NAD(P)-dependent oxidoreductase [Actinomadura gamaensis]|uniref:SDR family NAD(P)-dependent oxidoreductase n=1 Tax=Actinomadura gamaensis TaxID=1763541 RepID=A0ABV9TW64_9ACTN
MANGSKVAVVTGGTRGLGRDIADALHGAGWHVVRASRSGPAPRTWPPTGDDAEPRKRGGDDAGPWAQGGDDAEPWTRDGDAKDRFLPVDVRDPVSVRALLHAVREEFGGFDLLVANAGISRPGPVAALAPDSWEDVVQTNLTGVFHCVQAAIPYLERSADGRIITVSSVLGSRPVPGAAAYAAAKSAVETFSKVAALELAPAGITVNCLSPGFIDAGMGRELAANRDVWPAFEGKLALGRMGTGDEVARAALFLAGADSSYVNGHVLEVNGGLRW